MEPRSDRARTPKATPEMSWSLGVLLLSGPMLALIWLLLLPHPAVGSLLTFVGVCLLSIAVGSWLLLGARRLRPVWHLHALIVLAVVLVSLVVASAGDNRGLAVFYLFVAPYVWAFFSVRAATLHTLLTAVVSLGTLILQQPRLGGPPIGEVLGRWLFIVCCLLSVSFLIRSLTASLRRAMTGQERQADVSRVLAGFMQRVIERDLLVAHFEDAVRTVKDILGASMASVVERDGDATLRLATSVGARNPVPPGTRFADTDDFIAYVIAAEGPVLCHDLTTEDRFVVPQALLDDGQRAGLMAPIQHDGEVVGLLQAFSRTPGKFDAEDALTLTALAATLSQVVYRDAVDEEMARRALHDPLTGLPNRALFGDRLDHAVAQRLRHGGELAVIFADLDRFKTVNDTYGHAIGDELLVSLAPRLAALMREGDTVARFGGDEFVFLLEGLAGGADAVEAASRLSAAAQAVPLVMPDGVVIHVSMSMGVSLSRGRENCAEAMIAEADAAMYLAKASGGGQVRLFDDREGSSSQDRRLMESQLRQALSDGSLSVAYQPVVDVHTALPVGFEVAARWDHPERGVIGPREFMSVAEDAGLITALDELVLRTAAHDGASWQAATGQPLVISVNVSARHLTDPSFTERFLAIYAKSRLLPQTLCLEIAETDLHLTLDAVGTRAALAALHAAGVLISLDDFGTGYSSLTRLREFPIDAVKIDRSFVEELLTGDADAAIVEGVIVMARRMGLPAVAQGVESAAVHSRLSELGCPLAQGVLFSEPLPREDVAAYLRRVLPCPRDGGGTESVRSSISAVSAVSAVSGPATPRGPSGY